MGYISSRAPQPATGYGAGIGFYWYKFIDQPSLQQYSQVWSEALKAVLQSTIEKIQ